VEIVEKTKPVIVPFNLEIQTGSQTAKLFWQVNRDSSAIISGYNIYFVDSSNNEGELYNNSPYPGDTDGDITRESIILPDLENGRTYSAYIKTVYTDYTLSEPSATVSFTPLAQGTITLSQNHTDNNSGYSFALEKYTKARDFENDIYIYSTGTKAGISSPSRLHSSLRETLITRNNNSDFTQPLKKGQIYILTTADGAKVKLALTSLSDRPSALEATFDYIYYPPGVPIL